jgi:hypothetical protein
MTLILASRYADGSEPYGQTFPLGAPLQNFQVSPFTSQYLALGPEGGDLVTTQGNGVNTTAGKLDCVADSPYTGTTLVNGIYGFLSGNYVPDSIAYKRPTQVIKATDVMQLQIPFIPVYAGGTAALITAVATAIADLTGAAAVNAFNAFWATIMPTNASLAALVGKTFGITSFALGVAVAGCTPIITPTQITDSPSLAVYEQYGQVIDLNKPAATHADSSFFDLIAIAQNGTNTGNVSGAGFYSAWVRVNATARLFA